MRTLMMRMLRWWNQTHHQCPHVIKALPLPLLKVKFRVNKNARTKDCGGGETGNETNQAFQCSTVNNATSYNLGS